MQLEDQPSQKKISIIGKLKNLSRIETIQTERVKSRLSDEKKIIQEFEFDSAKNKTVEAHYETKTFLQIKEEQDEEEKEG